MLAANTEIWIPDDYNGFLEAVTLEEFAPGQMGKVKLVKTQTEISITGQASKRVERREGVAGESAPLDLSNLAHLSRASILQATREHHAQQRVYSSVGPILLSVNPYQTLQELYSTNKKQEYFAHANPQTLEPHLYQIAAKAFFGATTTTSSTPNNQSIIFSGESGGGKTMASRLLTEFLVYCSAHGARENQVQQRLVNAVPLIESFGNAQTERNDNSSRFGCWTVIDFADNAMSGASLKAFNLEKSRVVSRAQASSADCEKQRNFHIFYQFVASKPQEEGEMNYRYLAGTSTTAQDAANFALTKQTMLDLNMDVQSVLNVLQGVLELGNVDFNEAETEEGHKLGGKASIANPEQVAKVCKHLGIDSVEELCTALIQRDMSNAKEVIFTPYNKAQAEESRDALAKHLYGRLFDFLLTSINASMKQPAAAVLPNSNKQGFIGLLDMYGFEIFAVNSLEQLCINYCNERIMEAFNTKYIYEEAEFYRSEGISTNLEAVKRDRAVLDLLEASPAGILNLLDEECKIPKGSDGGLLKRLRKVLTTNAKFIPHIPQEENLFAISHFASMVRYNVQGFLDKNRDTLPNQLEELCQRAQGILGEHLFAVAAAISSGSAAPLTRQRSTLACQKLSVSYRFRTDLRELMDTVERTETHFVRCIKPNSTNSPTEFQGSMVLAQLSYSGVLETCKLRQEHGYELRQTHAEFIKRQARFFPSNSEANPSIESLVAEVNAVLGTSIQLGKSFVFVSTKDLLALDARGRTVHVKCVLVMQAFARMAVERKRHAKRLDFLQRLRAELDDPATSFARLDELLHGMEIKTLFAHLNHGAHLSLVKRGNALCATLEREWVQSLNDVERAMEQKDMVKIQLWLDTLPQPHGGTSPTNARLQAIVARARATLLEIKRDEAAKTIQRAMRAHLFSTKVRAAFADLALLSKESKPEEIAAVIRRLAKLGLAKHPQVQLVKKFVPTTMQRPNRKKGGAEGEDEGGDYDYYEEESINYKAVDLSELKVAVALARQKLQAATSKRGATQITLADATALRRAIDHAQNVLGATQDQLLDAISVETELLRWIAAKKLTWWQRMVSCGGCVPVPPSAYTMPKTTREFV